MQHGTYRIKLGKTGYPTIEMRFVLTRANRTEEYGIVGDLHPGDKIWSDFDLDTNTNKWSDPWTLEPGPAGQAAGRKKDSGGVTITLRGSTDRLSKTPNTDSYPYSQRYYSRPRAFVS